MVAIILDRRDYCEDRVAEIYVTFIEDSRFILPTTIGEEFIIELHDDEKEVLFNMDGWPSKSFRIFPNKDFCRFCFLCFIFSYFIFVSQLLGRKYQFYF